MDGTSDFNPCLNKKEVIVDCVGRHQRYCLMNFLSHIFKLG